MKGKSPPKRDTNLILKSAIILASTLFIILWICNGISNTMALLSNNLFTALIPFILLRIFRFCSELKYMFQQRTTSMMTLLLRSITMRGEVLFYIISTLLLNIFFNAHYRRMGCEDISLSCFCETLLINTLIVILYLIGADEYYTKKAIDFEQWESTMATGYYYGYLKIILPTLSKKINDYIDKNDIADVFKVKKLLVLIPSSAVLFDEVSTLGSHHIEAVTQKTSSECTCTHADSLEYICTRAFVINRSYKNTVYKIIDPRTKKRYYTVCEGATPLKTFYEHCKEDPSLELYKKEVVCAFYNTLKNLLDKDYEIKPFVELVYYDDDKRPGHGTETSNLLDIILDRLKEITREKETEDYKLYKP